MKKLLVLVFALISVLALTFAVSAVCYDDYDIAIEGKMSKVERNYGLGGDNNVYGSELNGIIGTGWNGGVALNWAGGDGTQIVYYYDEVHLVREIIINFYHRGTNQGYEVYLSNDSGSTWESIQLFYPTEDQVNVMCENVISVNDGAGMNANAFKFVWRGAVHQYNVSLAEIDITASNVLPCEWTELGVIQEGNCGYERQVDCKCAKCGEEKVIVTPATGNHVWNEGVVTKAPTVEEDGVKLCTCSVCEKEQEFVVPKLDHVCNFDKFESYILEPTCVNAGSAIYSCYCGETQEVVVEATGIHNYTIFVGYVEGKAPTYLKDGVAIDKCETCDATEEYAVPRMRMNFIKYADEYYSDHDDVWTIGTAAVFDGDYALGSATHHNLDTVTYTAQFGENYIFDQIVVVVNSTGTYSVEKHVFKWLDGRSTNTYDIVVCLRDAEGNAVYTSGKINSIADAIVSDDKSYSYIVIDFDEAVTATSMDVTIYNNKNNYNGLWEIEAYGLPENYHEDHTYTVLQETITAPTCAVDGLGVYRCNRCEETSEIVIPATGEHNYNQEVEGTRVDATCTDAGKVTMKCELCDATQENTLNALGHTEGTAATCTDAAICSVCRESYGEALGHSYEGEVNWDATCVQDGQMTYTCTVCGDTYTEVIPMDTENGHSWWEKDIDAATCKKPGVVYLLCLNCEAESSYEIEANPENHVWKNNEYTAPTCIEDGYVDRTCEECELNEQKVLPMDEMYHNWEEIENVEATCTTEGYTKTVCTVCKKEIVENFGKNEYNHDYEVSYGVLKVCECGDVTLGGTFVGIDNEYEITFDYGNFNIYICVDEDYIVDLYYDYEIVSSEDNVYNIKLTAQLTDDLGINGETVVLTLSDEGNTIVVTAADETVYNFENSAEEEEEVDFTWMDGTYTTADGAITFVIKDGKVDISANDTYVGAYSLMYTEDFAVVVIDDEINVVATWSADDGAWTYGEYSLTEEQEVVEIPELPVGENTIEILEGGTIQYVVSVPGDYTLVAGTDTDVYLVKGPYDSEWIEIYPYTFTVREGETVTFAIGRADVQAGTAYVTLTKEGATEPEEPEDVIDNSAINGEYFLPGNFKTFFTFMDGILIIEDENPMMMPSGMAGRYMYTYNVTTGEITLDPANFTMYVDNGVIYAVGVMPMPLSVVVPPMELEIGSTVIEVEDQWTGTTVVVSVAGTYILYAPEGTAPYIMVEDASGASAIEQYPYEFTVADGQVFKFIVLEPTTLTLAEKPAHVHTEVEIPAVLPTPSVTGYTAGIMCSDCGETIKAPVAINVTEMANTKDPSFRIASASLDLAESICVFYKSIVTEGYNNAYMVFLFGGEEFVVTEYTIEAGTGRYVYRFTGAPAYKMAENIEAYVYAETAEGEYSVNKILEYSVMTYCVNQLKKNASDAMYVRVISDVLTLGAANQVFEGYNTNALVTDLVEAKGYILTPTAFDDINAPTNVQALTGDRTQGVDWKSAGMLLGSNIKVQLKFETNFVNDVTVKINVAGEDRYFTAEDFTMDGNRYVVTIDYLTSKQYDDVITGTFYVDGKQIGSTLTYSVNSYIARNLTATGNKLTLLKAIYVYGETMKEFFAD